MLFRSCGCPAIGSYDGGIPDAVENEVNGLLVQSGSSNEIAKAIKKMFSDEDYRLSLAKKGIARVEESFTWKKLSAQMIDML